MTAPANAKMEWRVEGEEVVTCNCAWGCPCQFNALPTNGVCEAFSAWQIERGHFGETRLDGVRFAVVYHWPGAVHEGNGIRRLIVDERATPEQRSAIAALESGAHGHPFFEIFSSVAPHALEPVAAPIHLECDREERRATLRIPGIGENRVRPLANPVTGEATRARIDLPGGFEYRVAEVANAAAWHTTAGESLEMQHENTHCHFAHFVWSSDGTTG